ncbi:F-box/FBD/LRR-repeat-like protein [Cinnamomum micranthum f. kanehirae]|uniref:F-box/FBD/LRR-repeat-like protein n=1 Tax=Cinnamomum micranthum f. kanehirae TaxID=337451 RepID=A0A3S3PDZ5_9MAGN|nr:F-box/FBD/LRR-repeat-like protein [Cinnamomum micranthum f. kanehirae]
MTRIMMCRDYGGSSRGPDLGPGDVCARKRNGKSSSKGSRDVINNLSEDIINLILVHLPIRDAIRTIILSTKWRYKWVSISDLVFDRHCFSYNTEAVNVVDHVLLHHVGPIRKFSLDLGMPFSHADHYCHVNHLIVFLSRNEIKELFLSYVVQETHYKVPSSLFCCQKIDLSIQDVSLIDEDGNNLTRLIPNCPLLERLTLETEFCWPLKIHAPNLITLPSRVDM